MYHSAYCETSKNARGCGIVVYDRYLDLTVKSEYIEWINIDIS